MKDILVIDDEQEVLDVLRSILRTKGFLVRTAVGGEEGLDCVGDQKPDLILLDLMMPRVSGREVVRRLKTVDATADIPIVIMSPVGGEDGIGAAEWAQWLGVDDFLTKPIEPLDLLGRVEALLRRDEYVSHSRPAASRKPQFFDLDEDEEVVGEAGASKGLDTSNLSPAEVVAAFVEAWNAQDWAVEYDCLSDEVRSAMSLEDYQASRREAYAEEDPPRVQTVQQVLGERAAAGVARVEIAREDRAGERVRLRKARFTLRHGARGWQIIKSTDEPMPVE